MPLNCEYFIFNGTACSDYELMIYEIGNSADGNGKFSSPVKIIEDRTANRYSPLHYGITQNTPLSFSITFGVNLDRIDSKRPLDRLEINTISSWLIGHREYKYLEFLQPDMENVRYKCIVSDLEYIPYASDIWAFKCTFICDSPFGYMLPSVFEYEVSGSSNIVIDNISAPLYYFPNMKINITEGTDFKIINHSDCNRTFEFQNIPSSAGEISIDNENEIITSEGGFNLYGLFNYNFFRLVRGLNEIELSGNGTVSFGCEFPVDIGGL